MTWYIGKESHYEVLNEIDQQTDRGAAIVAAALVEDYLSDAIKTRLHARGKARTDVIKGLFDRALGTFAAKIDLGFALGLYLEDAHKDLNTVRLVRNQFAHHKSQISFTSGEPSRLCRDVRLIRQIRQMDIPPEVKDLDGGVKNMVAKECYIRTCKILISLLLAQSLRPPPLPPLPNF
jgi:hypothetical protein